jgi:hypothetical protein
VGNAAEDNKPPFAIYHRARLSSCLTEVEGRGEFTWRPIMSRSSRTMQSIVFSERHPHVYSFFILVQSANALRFPLEPHPATDGNLVANIAFRCRNCKKTRRRALQTQSASGCQRRSLMQPGSRN